MVGRNISMFKKFNLFWFHLRRHSNGNKSVLKWSQNSAHVSDDSISAGIRLPQKGQRGQVFDRILSLARRICCIFFVLYCLLVYYVYCLYSVWYVLSLYYVLFYCIENILVDFHLLTAVEHIVSEISWQKRNILVWVVFYQRQQFVSFGDNILYHDYDMSFIDIN